MSGNSNYMVGLWGPVHSILSSSPVVVPMAGAPLPSIIKLYVTAGDTLVLDQSFDGGLTYDTPLLTTTTSQGVRLDAGCSHIRVTLSAGTSSTSYFTVCG
jgi:hypothetical protein